MLSTKMSNFVLTTFFGYDKNLYIAYNHASSNANEIQDASRRWRELTKESLTLSSA